MVHPKRTLWALALATACGGDTDKGTDSACIEGAAQDSVLLAITDMNGTPIEGAVATWNNGGDEQECDQVSNNYLCGRDVTGEITVTGTAEGYQSTSKTVTVESDGCHAITEQEVLRLEAE